MEIALEHPNTPEETQKNLLDGVFEKLDQEQRAGFFADVTKYVRESGLMKRWTPDKIQAARKLFAEYKTKKFIELEEQKQKAA